MDDAMLLMTDERAFDRAIEDAGERLRQHPDCTWRDVEAWD